MSRFVTISLVLVFVAIFGVAGPAHAGVISGVLNGSFEITTGDDKFGGGYGIYLAQDWTDLTVPASLTQDEGSTTTTGPKGNYDLIAAANVTGLRYMRLASNVGNYGAIAQDLGTMEANKTYTITADVFGGVFVGNPAGNVVYASLLSAITGTPTVYATTNVTMGPGAFSADGLSISFTTGANVGQELWIKYAAKEATAGSSVRIGLDNVRLTINSVPEPATIGLLGMAAVAGLLAYAWRKRK